MALLAAYDVILQGKVDATKEQTDEVFLQRTPRMGRYRGRHKWRPYAGQGGREEWGSDTVEGFRS